MKAAVIEGINKVTVKDIPAPQVRPGYAVIKVAYGGFCGPTEMTIIKGLHTRAKFPLVFCHEFSGTVQEVETNKNCTIKIGDKVVVNPLLYCNECYMCRSGNQHICKNLRLIGIDYNGGFEEYCLVPINNLIKLPDDMQMDVAALSEPMAVGVHAVRESGFQMGNTALVFGAGPIGLMLAEVCKLSGAGSVTVMDINKDRLAVAKAMGYDIIKDPRALIKQGRDKFDFVYETTGAEAVLAAVVDCTKIKGYIGIVGKFDFPAPLNLHDILFNEITLKGFRVYRDKDFLDACSILYKDQARYKGFISDYFPLEKISEAIKTFNEKKNLARIMVSFT